MIKLAIVGSEANVHTHLKKWSKVKDVKVVAVLPIPESDTFNDQDTTLWLKDVDAIDVCVHPHQKIDIIRKFYRENVYIITSSPLAESSGEATAFIAECKQHKVRLYVSNLLNFSPEYVQATHEVENNSLGTPGVSRLSVSKPHSGDEQDIFLMLGVPQFEWLIQTFGNVKRVMAKHVKHHPVEYSLLSLRMQNDAFVHVELRWLGDEPSSAFELAGSHGMLSFNSKDAKPVQLQRFTRDDSLEANEEKALIKELEHITYLIKQNKVPTLLASEKIHALQIAEAARESVLSRNAIELKEGEAK